MTTPSAHLEKTLGAARLGDRKAAAELLPLVYNELRSLARSRMGHVPPGNTLQPTALVHEAFLKLVGTHDPGWDTRGHFFAAAAEAMRQVLVDQARRKKRVKRGGEKKRIENVEEFDVELTSPVEDILALDEAIERLRADDERKAQIVTLRCFAGLSRDEVAAVMDLSVPTIDREWRYIVARLHKELGVEAPDAHA
ncbi:MAG: sigma-70 family RNA polymerase sigma factor [Phycisphaerales bacterium]|nr:sigma-70 family RNA polymerase sigma factor [Phycisphaerales bacterium]